MRAVLLIAVLVAMSGCARFGALFDRAPADPMGIQQSAAPAEATDGETEVPEPVLDLPGASAPKPAPTARTAEQFDTTTEKDRAAAVAPVQPEATETRLGTTIASLGNPAAPGFWAETPLVSEVREGRLDYPATGKSVTVELRPSGGAAGSGTRVSLPALRLLEAPLTALPELVVFGL